jgi:Rad3-related DNA helicase
LIIAPTGCGKTAIRRAISGYFKDTAMLVPTNALIDQEVKEFPDTNKILAKHLYKYSWSLKKDEERVKRRGEPVLCVPHMYLARHLQRRTLVVDEGHKLVTFNQELQSDHIWRSDVGYPSTIHTRKDLERWLVGKDEKKLLRIKEKLATDDYILQRGKSLLRGKWEDRLSLIPLSPPLHRSLIRGVSKIFLLSATLSEVDLEDLGVARTHRVMKLELPSVIPVDRRPFIKQYVGAMSYSNLDRLVPMIAAKIQSLAARNLGKGLVHVTYDLARRLQAYLPGERFVFHTPRTSKDMLKRWQESADKVFIASGYEEGLNLKGSDYLWQVITKVPWLSLADPAIKKRAQISDRWYIWQTLKKVIQAYGRICRGPTDMGTTYILDATFERLYEKGLQYDLVPMFFAEAVK